MACRQCSHSQARAVCVRYNCISGWRRQQWVLLLVHPALVLREDYHMWALV